MGQAAWCSALFCALFRSLFGHCSWTLFMDTVHEHCSQVSEKKKYIYIYIYIYIYKIFIWQLL